jgi:hypothetical protein
MPSAEDGSFVPIAYAIVMNKRSLLWKIINEIISSVVGSGIFLKLRRGLL